MQVSKHHHTLCGILISLIQFVFHLILKSCIIFCSILELVCQRSQYPCRTSWQHLALSKLMDNSGYTVPSSHNALKCEKSKILGNVTIMVTNKFLRVCSVSQKKTLILAFEAISVNFNTSIFFQISENSTLLLSQIWQCFESWNHLRFQFLSLSLTESRVLRLPSQFYAFDLYAGGLLFFSSDYHSCFKIHYPFVLEIVLFKMCYKS